MLEQASKLGVKEMINKQTQEGGEGSTNIQAQNIYIHGIDEKRAREICQEMNLQLRKEYSEEAFKIATTRVSEFENILMSKMDKVEGALEAFTDPSFQLLLLNAQKAAASTERIVDYELLSELLIHRFQRGENRLIRAGIRRAVEVVDEISDEALLGLTVFHSVQNFLPVTGDIFHGLDVLNDLFGKVIYGPLPTGMDWLDHLDILDAVRINSSNKLKSLSNYYSELLSGYTDVGIKRDSEEHINAVKILQSCGLSVDFLGIHELNNEFVRIRVRNKRSIEALEIREIIILNEQTVRKTTKVSKVHKEALDSIYDMYVQDAQLKSANVASLMDHFDRRASLNTLNKWWSELNVAIQLTSVGRVLAHSNAQRCDSNLPPFS